MSINNAKVERGILAGINIEGGFPTDGQVLQYNAATNLWKFVALPTSNLGDLQFIQTQLELGNWLRATGVDNTGAGVVGSIIPAAGKTFFHFLSSISIDAVVNTSAAAHVQNNGTTYDNVQNGYNSSVTKPESHIRDSLIGDGAKAYRIIMFALGAAVNVRGSIEGWIDDT